MGLKGLLGAAKSATKVAAPIVAGGIAGAVGGPVAGAAAKTAVSKIESAASKKAPARPGASVQSQVRQIPQVASSLPEARAQDKARIKRSYGYPQ